MMPEPVMAQGDAEAQVTRHETGDVRLSRIVATGIGLAVVILVVHLVTAWMLQSSREEAAARTQATTTMAAQNRGDELPPEPRLEGVQATEASRGPLRSPYEPKLLHEQQLQSYGWVDEHARVTRIPIRNAMKLVVERQGAPLNSNGEKPR